MNFDGPDFLIFYALLSCLILATAQWIKIQLTPRDTELREALSHLSAYEIAALVGKRSDVVKTAIVSLIQQDFATAYSRLMTVSIKVSEEKITHPVEKEVAEAIVNGDNSSYKKTRLLLIDTMCQQASSSGNIANVRSWFICRFFSMLPVLALLLLGIAKILVGLSRDKPVGYLSLMCIFVTFWLLQLFFSPKKVERSRILQIISDRHRQSCYEDYKDPRILIGFAGLGSTALTGHERFNAYRDLLAPPPRSISVPKAVLRTAAALLVAEEVLVAAMAAVVVTAVAVVMVVMVVAADVVAAVVARITRLYQSH